MSLTKTLNPDDGAAVDKLAAALADRIVNALRVEAIASDDLNFRHEAGGEDDRTVAAHAGDDARQRRRAGLSPALRRVYRLPARRASRLDQIPPETQLPRGRIRALRRPH